MIGLANIPAREYFMAMQNFKAFKTSEMPDEVFSFLGDCGFFVEDGFCAYTVCAFVTEVENAHPNDKGKYSEEEYRRSIKVDDYFIKAGAAAGETILVWHE